MRKILFLAICIILTGVLVGSICAQNMESFFQTVAEPTRNDYSGVSGIEFTVNKEINVMALGRPVTTTFDQDHTITLWRTADQQKIAEAVAGPNSPVYEVENGSYAYEILDIPVVLSAGETYRLMSEEYAGGDNWATCYMVTPGTDITNVASINGIPWGAAGEFPANLDPTPNKVDIGCTFFYGSVVETPVKSAEKLCTIWAKLKK